MAPLFVFEFIASLNLGEQVIVAIVLLTVLWYLYRMRSIAGTLIAAVGTVWLLAAGAIVATAVGVFLGWFDPNPVAFVNDVVTAGEKALRIVTGPVYDWVTGLV